MNEHPQQPARPQIKIYTDGGCEPNPGRGGYGVVVVHDRKRAEASGGFRRTTNNRMEIYAAIRGLAWLNQPCRVTLYSDSQYLVRAMTEGWAVKWQKKNWWRTHQERALNADLWETLLALCTIHQVKFVWIKGHAGHAENERCDQLSSTALRQPNPPVDAGYENPPAAVDAPPRRRRKVSLADRNLL